MTRASASVVDARASCSACSASVIAKASLTRRLRPAAALHRLVTPRRHEPEDAVGLPGRPRRAAGGPAGGQLGRPVAGGGGAAGPGGAGPDAGAGLGRCSRSAAARAQGGATSTPRRPVARDATDTLHRDSNSATRIRGSVGGRRGRPSSALIARYSGDRPSSSTNRHTRRSAASRSSRETARSATCARSAVRRRSCPLPSRCGATCSARSLNDSDAITQPRHQGTDSPCKPCSIRSPVTPLK
jgi:hypothetical protein